MTAQTFIQPLISGKMKTSTFLASLFLVIMPLFSNAATVSFGVTFGNPQSNGGACVGKGVCRESLDMDMASGTYMTAPEAVTVMFVTNAMNPGILMMRFSFSDLLRKQPEQAGWFTDPTGYSFETAYSLDKPQFLPFGFPAGSQVAANVKYTVSFTGDMVTVYIPYAHEG